MTGTGIRAVFAGAVIREREARGWSRAELARQAGVTEATLSNIEGQKQGPSLYTASRVARALGMTSVPLDEEAGGG